MTAVNGTLDDAGVPSDADNPFAYPNPPAARLPARRHGIYAPPAGQGADFALGANWVHPGGGTGSRTLANFFSGRMGMFAVHSRALARSRPPRAPPRAPRPARPPSAALPLV
jgi:hypothetical protein